MAVLAEALKTLAERVEKCERWTQPHENRLRAIAKRVTACEDAETELAQDVSAHAGRLLALETPKDEPAIAPDLHAKRDAVDALLAEMGLRIGALQWDQPGPDTDERRGFREGAAWALNLARSLRP